MGQRETTETGTPVTTPTEGAQAGIPVPDPDSGPTGSASSGGSDALAASVRRCVGSLVKTIKTSRLYPAESAIRLRFAEELFQHLTESLAFGTPISLRIGRGEIFWEEQSVHRETDREESPLDLLYWDGLSVLSFLPGLQFEELQRFLETVSLADSTRESGRDNLPTLLWARHFTSIRHLDIDALAQREDELDPFEAPEQFVGEGLGLAGLDWESIRDPGRMEHPAPAGGGRMQEQDGGPDPRSSLPVSAQERDDLRREWEEVFDPARALDGFFRLVEDAMRLEPEADDAIELVAIVQAAGRMRLNEGNTELAARLYALLRGLRGQEAPVSSEMGRALDRALALEVEPEAISAWAANLDRQGDAGIPGLTLLVEALPASAAPALCELLGQIQTMRIRRRLIDLLVPKAQANPKAFAGFLQDRRWYLVRNVALILGRSQAPEAAEMVGPLIRHQDPRVRKEALKILAQRPDAATQDVLAHALGEADAPLRLWAARTLAGTGLTAMPRLQAVLESREFERRDLPERIAFYQAFAYSGREAAVPLLRGVLEPRGLLKPRLPDPLRIGLIEALGIAGGPVARELLSARSRDRTPAIREAATRALAVLAAGANPCGVKHE